MAFSWLRSLDYYVKIVHGRRYRMVAVRLLPVLPRTSIIGGVKWKIQRKDYVMTNYQLVSLGISICMLFVQVVKLIYDIRHQKSDR